MQAYRRVEMSVGVFVFLGILAIGWLALQIGQVGGLGESGYTLVATFGDVGGIRRGGNIMLAGVVIGRVDKVSLVNSERAKVVLRIHKDVQITEDAFASVRTKGIIGDRYIRITQGISQKFLASGQEIMETESAINIEDLISKYIFSGNAK